MKLNKELKIYIAIGIGGMLGAVGRYSISTLWAGGYGFPYATLTANLIGCFLLSFLLNHNAIKKKLSPIIFASLSIGIIGAFTTFSTFAVETVELWSTSAFIAISYILISIAGGLTCCYGGYKFALNKKKVIQ
ncbi:fluoride efflux transporter CrcB [Virgibacillus sp. C22-A2]|uniref:Fluoride-specific ion channel FluC n=1 Tax=Virgibacillus tibetensis TaxID=3042313 RepID=A0ABU6KI53_9BACI|nr:fluoride efflux transporter CrcB [Virgibacillus sp. C22-A2]